jgi:hypothetical protein
LLPAFFAWSQQTHKPTPLTRRTIWSGLPMRQFPRPKEFLQHGGVTRILQLVIQVIADEVEEGFEVGIAGVLG